MNSLYGAHTQTYRISPKANTLNYGLHSVPKDATLLGLKHVKGELAEYMSLVKLEGECFTICSVMKCTSVKRWECDSWKEEEQFLINKGYTYLVTLKGCDDHTGYTRFKSLEDAIQWYVSDESINYDSDKYWMVN